MNGQLPGGVVEVEEIVEAQMNDLPRRARMHEDRLRTA